MFESVWVPSFNNVWVGFEICLNLEKRLGSFFHLLTIFVLYFVWDLYESGWGFAWQDKTVEKSSKFCPRLSCTLPTHNGTCPTQKYEYNLGKYTLEFEQIQIRFWRNTDYSLVMLYSCHAQCPPTMEHVPHRNMNIAWRNINFKKIAI